MEWHFILILSELKLLTMLRIFHPRSRFLCVVFACILFAGCTQRPEYSLQTGAALERLDAELLRKERYQQWRQEQADKLREGEGTEPDSFRRARKLFDVSQIYVTYNLDSAAYYVNLLYGLADKAGSQRIHRIALLADIDVWLGRGQLGLAEELFRRIDTAGMAPWEYDAWHSRYSSVANRRYAETEDSLRKRAWGDTVVHVRSLAVPGQSELTRARMKASALRDEGRYEEAIRLLEPFTARVLSNPDRALLYYGLAGIARRQGDEDKGLYYLAESSIADLQAGTRSYSSLYDLALALFDRKDYDRAAAYMGCSSDDAMHCRSMVRIPVSSSATVKISEAISSNIAQRQAMMSTTIWLAGIFLVVLAVILWYVLWQHRRLRGNHRQLLYMSDQLREKNDELQAKNGHIREINTALVDSNRIKDRYVCHYIDLSVHYIKQIEAFRREVCRVARTKGVDELVRWLNTSQAASGEYAKFYQSFDSSFLDIFPQFIEQVNALLQPESRFSPRTDASLTTELRILAAIRLGITDSGHIASLLNCASATVYTYRTKLRNAALDRDDFEQQVSRIGL